MSSGRYRWAVLPTVSTICCLLSFLIVANIYIATELQLHNSCRGCCNLPFGHFPSIFCTSKHVTPGKLILEIFARKTRNFFLEVAHCVRLQYSVVIKYFPHLSQNQSQSFFLMCWFNMLHIWKVGFGNNFSQNSQIFSTLFTMLTFVRLFSSTHWLTQGVGAWRCYDI